MGLWKETAKVCKVCKSIGGNYVVVMPRSFGKPQNGCCGCFQPAAYDVFVSCSAIRSPDSEDPTFDRNTSSRDIAFLLSIPYREKITRVTSIALYRPCNSHGERISPGVITGRSKTVRRGTAATLVPHASQVSNRERTHRLGDDEVSIGIKLQGTSGDSGIICGRRCNGFVHFD